ncbi:MAG: hypothetical protein HYX42_20980 [Polaromonas sp.]|uniref:hypothetical protein n=1 Tax=Polaromonas sp. TaxID=1869339 RepID=UPI0025F45B80|nr:hypothetical protein [Polaromonas sp.]MBI2728722.1 hypothetical protein [Polaromonas sp.]
MNAIKRARRLIKSDPTSASAITLANLVRALESDEAFALGDLYKLGFDDFNLGLDVLKEWRLDRYYMSKGKLIDIAVQLHQLN